MSDHTHPTSDVKHKWEIESRPDDVSRVDDDQVALEELLAITARAWDDIEPGEERVIRIRRNKVAGDE